MAYRTSADTQLNNRSLKLSKRVSEQAGVRSAKAHVLQQVRNVASARTLVKALEAGARGGRFPGAIMKSIKTNFPELKNKLDDALAIDKDAERRDAFRALKKDSTTALKEANAYEEWVKDAIRKARAGKPLPKHYKGFTAAHPGLIDDIKIIAKLPSKAFKQEGAFFRAEARAAVEEAKNVKSIVGRGSRGERLPSATVATVGHIDEQIGASITDALRLVDTGERRKAIKSLIPEAEAALKSRQESLAKSRRRRKGAVRTVEEQFADEGLGQVTGVNQLRDAWFTADEVKQLEQAMDLNASNSWVRVSSERAGQVGDALRVVRAGFDFGAPFLQGLPALARDIAETPLALVRGKKPPNRWAQATAAHYKAFWQDPIEHQKYLNDNLAAVNEMVAHGVPLSKSATDYYQGLNNDALIPTIARNIPGGKAGADVLERFQRSFDTFGDRLRVEWWKGSRDAATKSATGLDELADAISNSTGALSTASLGISPTQQAVERAFIFFSPRYTRASLAMIADAFQVGPALHGNVKARQAQANIASMMAVGAGMAYIVAELQGEDPVEVLTPGSSKFMTFKLGDDRIGPGSFFTSFSKMAYRTATTGLTDPGAFLDPSTRDNPLLAWVRSRSAPVGGVAWDRAAGADFLGNKLESPMDWTKHLGTQMLPFAMEAAAFQDPSSGPFSGGNAGFPAFGAEFAGSRTFPVLARERRDLLRDEKSMARHGVEWEELNRLQQERLEGDFEDLSAVTEEIRQQSVLRGEDIDQKVAEFFRITDDNHKAWLDQVNAGLALVPDNDDLGDFRKDVLIKANVRRRAASDILNTMDEFADVREYFKNLPKKSSERPEDVAYGMYITMVTDPKFDTPSGVNFDALDAEIRVFEATWGAEVLGYVRQRLDEGKDLPGVVSEFYKGREAYRFYWDQTPEVVINSEPPAAQDSLRRLYAEYRDAPDLRQRDMLEANPGLDRLISKISRVKSAAREQNPGLDAFLFRWGYTGTLKHPFNEGREVELNDPTPLSIDYQQALQIVEDPIAG